MKPPSESELAVAQDALTAKYDEAAQILEALQAETAEIKGSLASQCEKVEASVEQVSSALTEIKEKEESRDEELRAMKDEVDAIKSLMEKVGRVGTVIPWIEGDWSLGHGTFVRWFRSAGWL